MSDDLPIRLPRVDPATVHVPAGSLTPELLAGLLADGDDQLAVWALQHALDEEPRARVYDGLVTDAMRLVGEHWGSGRWSVAEEHLASRTLLRALERVRPETGPESRIAPLAVLAGVRDEHHVIGLVCLEHVLIDEGWSVANMGANLPAEDLATFLGRNDVSLVALTAMDKARVAAIAEAVTAVRDAEGDRHIPVLIGGQVSAAPNLLATTDADAIATSTEQAAAVARAYLDARDAETQP